jgi:hypothetical protein
MVLWATWESHAWWAVATLDCLLGRRAAVVSERLIVPLKPGNAGGGKEPHFWVRTTKPRMRRLA